MKTIRILASLLLGTMVFQSHAQQQLSLSDAIKFALQNKADAKKAGLDVANAESKIAEVRSSALPQVNLTSSLNLNPKIQQNAITMIDGKTGESTTMFIEFGQKWQSTNAVSLTQQLFNQTVFTGLKAAKTTREFYVINKTLTDEQLIEKVANSYYDVYQSKLQLKTIENNLESTTKTRDVIEGLFKNGLAKKIDLDRTNVAVTNLKASRQQVINAVELKENALKFVIGMQMSEQIAMPTSTFETVALNAVYEPIDITNRTEIQVLSKQNELLELNKKAEVSKYYPTLSFTANYGYMGMGPVFPIFSKNGGVKWNSYNGVGLNLSIPIFNGFLTRSKVRQAQIDIDKLQVDIADTKLALNLAAENSKVQIKNSLLTIESNRKNVDLAKSVLEDTNNNYKNGLATLTDLLDAENAYADAQNNLNTSLLDYKIAEVQLIKANGNLKSLIKE
ncbi:TolC family protein [Sphingobacterium multivorum]|uniref:TolC family protein n=1 Tax=Sphingobacterium multivorum TaxID=28454 RepID=UPI0028B255CD|nr:TolC family protein [Sphingobacterium multivorum]